VARIPLVDPSADDADPAARAALQQLTPGGIHPNVYRAIANHPGALEAFSAFGKMVYFDNSITPAQRELAYLTASATNDCHY
jgi:alkylhydroperoxidase family enzyme